MPDLIDEDDAGEGLDLELVEALPIQLSNLSEMRSLTSLDCSLSEFEDDDMNTTCRMIPVCGALGSLSELHELRLGYWTFSAQTGDLNCWETLASALPTLPHLTCLKLSSLRAHGAPEYVLALAPGLSCLTSLRSLTMTGHHGDAYEIQVWSEGSCEASAALACAVGALYGLTQLTLRDTGRFLAMEHCYKQLHALSGLRSLVFDIEVSSMLDGQDIENGQLGGVCVGTMLPGLPQLTSLSFDCCECLEVVSYVGSDGAPCQHTTCPHCDYDCLDSLRRSPV